ncbi:MAG: hypothetical protein Q4G54_10675 [Pelistega sp.]|nr:hypothetical protein [Pelistega sp.]
MNIDLNLQGVPMREKLEAAVLTLAGHDSWVDQLIEHTHRRSDKLKLFKVDLQSEILISGDPQTYTYGNMDYPNPEILQRIHFLLDRFDVLLLPVSNASLVWNRVLLAHTQCQLNRPLIALSIDINPIAFIDLKELGLKDFVSAPMDTDELRVRLLSAKDSIRLKAGRLEEPIINSSVLSVQKSIGSYPLPHKLPFETHGDKPTKTTRRRVRLFDAQVTAHEAFSFNDSFKIAKANVIMEFERKYIIHALIQSNGNIGQAAKAACKHRRAFWELMRKHGIDADNYRDMLKQI